MNVPDIGNLLGTITSKRDKGELGKTERQHVAPVKTEPQENDKAFAQEKGETNKRGNDKTLTRYNVKTGKRVKEVAIGRPTTKSSDIQYVRMGVVIPKSLRQKVADALTYERCKTKDGYVVKTLDDIVTLALARLLEE